MRPWWWPEKKPRSLSSGRFTLVKDGEKVLFVMYILYEYIILVGGQFWTIKIREMIVHEQNRINGILLEFCFSSYRFYIKNTCR